MQTVDATVIGGGIAGVSVAAELAALGADVALVEMEATLAFHTTGRSAAQYLRNYGNDVVRRLTIASASYFEAGDEALWSPRSFMRIGRDDVVDILRADATNAKALAPSTEFLTGDEARALVPVLTSDVRGALFEPDSRDLDVAAIHQSFVRRLRAEGGAIRPHSPATVIERRDNSWLVQAGDEQFVSPVVVNASGAWGDVVARLAGVTPLGLHPLRRTIAIAKLPAAIDASGWPLIAFESGDGSMGGYCKPEGDGLMISPADETPDVPRDARPEEVDVAMAIDQVNTWTTLGIRAVGATWAGLRTFTADRSPVAGFAPDAPGFFWMVGQGGYGIQMAPALARAAAGLVQYGRLPTDLVDTGLTVADLAPDRPGLRGPLLGGH